MKRVGIIFCILFLFCGCSNQNVDFDSYEKKLSDIMITIEKNNSLIEELKKKNEELESKILVLEDSNEKLNDTISELNGKIVSLENSDKGITSSIDNKYGELKSMINNNNSSYSNYTISKSELLGTWNAIGSYSASLSFTNDNVDVVDDWIIYKGSMAVNYMYKDGTLYLSDDGYIMTK